MFNKLFIRIEKTLVKSVWKVGYLSNLVQHQDVRSNFPIDTGRDLVLKMDILNSNITQIADFINKH